MSTTQRTAARRRDLIREREEAYALADKLLEVLGDAQYQVAMLALVKATAAVTHGFVKPDMRSQSLDHWRGGIDKSLAQMDRAIATAPATSGRLQ